MTVKELIEALSKQDPDVKVWIQEEVTIYHLDFYFHEDGDLIFKAR